ncbi:MAG: DUF4382 domain-containing protein [Pseudomonadales bacterium]
MFKYLVAFTAILLISSGCGGGGGSSAAAPVSAAPAETGEVIIGLTDAEGDFLSYIVDVTSVQLERADGTRVETLPLSTRVDFAELTEVTELVSIATVPAGRYLSATLGLDFTNAEVIVQDDNGDLHTALLTDENGDPLGAIDVNLMLTDADAVVIRPGVPAAFSLDFDLDASNTIDFTASPPEVTVMPFLLAAAELEADRTHRVRGLLGAVDEAQASFTLDVRPFRLRSGRFGELTVQVDDATLYEIDGMGYEGAAGLAALTALGEDAPVVASGSPVSGTPASGALRAETVLAGSSVPWTDHDVAHGAVVARSGDALTLSGVTLEYADGLIVHRGQVTVNVGDDTRVTALGLPNDTLGKQSLSVGQRVLAFGSLTDDVTLDATGGRVRMEISQLTADVVDADDLAVDVHFLNGRRPAAYDFTGTGVDAANDADPNHYEIDTASLPLTSIEVGDLVRVRGHVTAFGSAPNDFTALSVIDVSLDHRAAAFDAVWPVPSAEPTLNIDSGHITLDLTDARALLWLLGVPLDTTNPLEALTLAAPDDGRGVYAVRVRRSGEIHLYRSFADLADEVLEQLQTGNRLRRVDALGSYNAAEDELVSHRAALVFVGPED